MFVCACACVRVRVCVSACVRACVDGSSHSTTHFVTRPTAAAAVLRLLATVAACDTGRFLIGKFKSFFRFKNFTVSSTTASKPGGGVAASSRPRRRARWVHRRHSTACINVSPCVCGHLGPRLFGGLRLQECRLI